MKKLKAAYIKVYLDLYRRARLNFAQDKEKKDLLQDFRLKHLRRLATVNSINSVQLTEFDRQLDKLKTGTALTEKDLENEPKSPDGFWPSMEDTSVSAETRLDSLKGELDQIHKSWTKSLLNDLADPVIQSHFDLLKAAQKKMLQRFMQPRNCPTRSLRNFSPPSKALCPGWPSCRTARRSEEGIVSGRKSGHSRGVQRKLRGLPRPNSQRPRCRKGSSGHRISKYMAR